VAVARAARLVGPLVASAPEEALELVLDRALEDELSTQAAELAERIGVVETLEEHPLDRFLDPGARGYPSVHGVVSFCGFQGPLRSLRRLHFSSGLRTPPPRRTPPHAALANRAS